MSPSPAASTARSGDGSKPTMSLNALLQTESFELVSFLAARLLPCPMQRLKKTDPKSQIRSKADLLARLADDFPGYNGVLHNPIADGDLDGVLRLSGNIVTSLDKIVLLRSQLLKAVPEPVVEPPARRHHPRMKPHKAVVSSHACHNCDTTDTPKWRAGPHGPRSLCNVCGLLNAKKKKRHLLRWSSRPMAN
ncbi:hypothetical protein L249_6452 [Ophiocordyceps polyrhachis-furcata BCC 54312]|uniref:GATA-type domain-containing protein n=1 Tax=Ophiocordyceps polyrhachis-furcata BCC 54312 TaxID=1330021 RepID=A0A367LKC8_9HYPO|nr:hypothetical protein L249_6452 [Ophiocordyceps polyrhachis-furcata BCC 54312]